VKIRYIIKHKKKIQNSEETGLDVKTVLWWALVKQGWMVRT